jgi:glycosyltransferase involved in cell wall biosynthesis
MRRLAIIPNDPIDSYLSSGYTEGWLRDYFNPCGVFDEVYSLAPYERVEAVRANVRVKPTPIAQIPRRLRDLRIDVVRAYGAAHPCDIASAARTNSIPVVVSVHDARPELLHSSIAEADVVLCVSETVKRLVTTRFTRESRLWMLPNRVDFSQMRPYAADAVADLRAQYPFKYRIVQVGRKAPEKNLETIIRSLAVLGPEYCLVAAGPGSTASYERLAADEGVADRCFLIGAVPNDQLARYYALADCVCSPSLTEAFNVALVEAIVCGAAVVASDIPAHREVIADGTNGLLVTNYQDPVALARALRTGCTNESVRGVLQANARASVQHFERGRIDALEADYYRRILELRDAGAFQPPLHVRIRRRAMEVARNMVFPLKNTMDPLIGG